MAYFDCIVGGSGKGNTLVVTCADELAGATITCTNGTKTYTKTCPSTAPYEVTFYGLAAGTWTVSATVSGDTYTTTVVVADIEALLGGFNWKTWVNLSDNYTSSDFTDLDDLLSDETAIRELMTIHACVDYLAGIAAESPDVETIIGNDLAAKWINLRDYALDTLHANTYIAAYMDTADKYFYGEWVITDNTTTPPTWGALGNVPVMTDDTVPYGEVICSTAFTSQQLYMWKAFDGDFSTRWCATASTNQYIGYKATNPIKVKKVSITPYYENSHGDVKNFKIQGSNDGSNWDDLYTGICAEDATMLPQEFEIDSNSYYLYHRCYVTDTYGNYVSIKELQFYGRELLVSVPKMTSNIVPYGEAICGAVLSGATQQAWLSFDKTIDSNGYETPDNAVSAGTAWLGYKFLNKTNVKMVTISNRTGYSGSDLHAFISGKLQGRNNDNEEWEDIDTITRTNYSTAGITTVHIVSNSGSYSQLRVKADTTLSNSGRLHITELQFYGLDYSEREFEQGTTKKWLYDHGVELETFTTNTSGSGSVATKDADSLYNSVPASTNVSASALVNIDLTNYSLARMVVGKEAYGSVSNYASGGLVVLSTTTPTYNTSPDAQNYPLPPINDKNNIALDISSFNTTKAIGIFMRNVSTGSLKKFRADELWLE